MQRRDMNETMGLLREDLADSASDFWYVALAENRQVTEEYSDYEKIKKALIGKFGRIDRPENTVKWKLEAMLEQREQFNLLNKINFLNKQAKLDEKPKSDFLKKQQRSHKISVKYLSRN